MLTAITKFSLEKHTGPYETWGTKSRLHVDGAPTRLRVPGFNMEAQYSIGDGYVLITSYGCPFEESQNFLLLNHGLRIVGRKCLGHAYSSFLLMRHYPIDANRIALEFAENDLRVLEIWPRRRPAFRRLHLRRMPSATQGLHTKADSCR
jgi:hypothetical protein